jgi:hypothetical protein
MIACGSVAFGFGGSVGQVEAERDLQVGEGLRATQ